MSAKLKIKRGTTASWADYTNKDTTLEPGQLGVEYLSDGNMRLKVGKNTADGSATYWTSLPYVTPKLSVYQDTRLRYYDYSTPTSGENTYRIESWLPDYDTGLAEAKRKRSNIIFATYTGTVGNSADTIGTEYYTGGLRLYSQNNENAYLLPISAIYNPSAKTTTNNDQTTSGTQGVNLGSDDLRFKSVYSRNNVMKSAEFSLTGTDYGPSEGDTLYTILVNGCGTDYKGSTAQGALQFNLKGKSLNDAGKYTDLLTSYTMSGDSFSCDSNNATLGSESNPWSDSYVTRMHTSSIYGSDIALTDNTDSQSNISHTINTETYTEGSTTRTVKTATTTISSKYNLDYDEWDENNDFYTSVVLSCKDPIAMHETMNLEWCVHPHTFGTLRPLNNSNSSLGDSDHRWDEVYCDRIYLNSSEDFIPTMFLLDDGIVLNDNIVPYNNSTSESTGYTLGTNKNKWRYLYAYSGTIQTSDRSAKDSIHYLESISNEDSSIMSAATMSLKSVSDEEATSIDSDPSLITVEDVIDFVSNLSPVTFCYKNGQGEGVEATEENSDPEEIQLGLIADDIKDHKLFKYVGVETTYEEEVTPAVEDEDGNVITEAVTETKTTRGLQAIPLATAALTACKYLIQKNEEVESRLALLEEQLTTLLEITDQ